MPGAYISDASRVDRLCACGCGLWMQRPAAVDGAPETQQADETRPGLAVLRCCPRVR